MARWRTVERIEYRSVYTQGPLLSKSARITAHYHEFLPYVRVPWYNARIAFLAFDRSLRAFALRVDHRAAFH